MARVEEILKAIVNGETTNIKPHNQIEEYLLALLNGETNVPEPKHVNEAYLYQLCKQGVPGGGTDENLVPENIKYGVTISGVTGTFEGGGFWDNPDPFFNRTFNVYDFTESEDGVEYTYEYDAGVINEDTTWFDWVCARNILGMPNFVCYGPDYEVEFKGMRLFDAEGNLVWGEHVIQNEGIYFISE